MKKILFALVMLISTNVCASQLFTSEELKNLEYTVQGGDCCATHNVSTILNLLSKERLFSCGDIYNKVKKQHTIGTNPLDILEYVNALNGEHSMAMLFSDISYMDENIEKYGVVSVIVNADLFYNSDSTETHFISIIGSDEENYIVLDTNRTDFVKIKKDFLLSCIVPNTTYYVYF